MILSELDFFQIWSYCGLKNNQNKHSKFDTKFVIQSPVEMTWSAHELNQIGNGLDFFQLDQIRPVVQRLDLNYDLDKNGLDNYGFVKHG